MRFFMAGLVILGLATAAARGQVRGEVESIGFGGDGLYRPTCWTPMVVRLDSQQDETVEYRIEVHQRDLDFDHVIYVKDGITLNGHATQKWQICFKPEPTNGGLPERLADLQDRLRVYLTNKDGTKQILQLPITSGVHTLELASSLGARAKEYKLVLYVAEGGSRVAWAEYENAIGLVEQPVAVRVNARELPQTALAYDAVDAVLWVNGDARVLSEQGSKQLSALRQWVKQGGMLVVCQPSGDGERARIAPFGDMLPIRWQENGEWKVSVQPRADLKPLSLLARKSVGAAAPRWDIPGPFPTARATTRPSAVVDAWVDWDAEGKESSPYVARIPCGLGSVTWVAQDLGDPKLTGPKSFGWPYVWDNVFGWKNGTRIRGDFTEKEQAEYAERMQNGPVDLGAAQLKGVEFQGKGAGLITLAMLFFVVYWVIAGPGIYLFLAGKKRTQHSWTAFGFSALGATLLTVLVVDLVLRGDPQVHHASVVRIVTGQEAQPAISQSKVGLYIPRDGAQRVSLTESSPEFVSYVTPMSVHPSYVPDNEFPANLDYRVPVREAGLTEPAAVDVPFRSTLKKLQVQWAGDMTPPLRADGVKFNAVGDTTDPISGSIDNLGGIDLRNVYIAFHFRGRDMLMYVPSLSAKAGNNHLDLKTMYTQAVVLNPGAMPPHTPEAGDVCRGDLMLQWTPYWSRILQNGAEQRDDLEAKIPVSVPVLSFFDRLPPSKNDAATDFRALTLLRRGARHMNLSAALAAGELVVVAQADKRPLPYTLEVNGNKTPGEGTVFYQFAFPIEHAGAADADAR